MNRHSFLSAVVFLAAIAACSDAADKPRICNAPADPPASFDSTTPVVSFSGEVVPLLTQSCATPDCHGAGASALIPLSMGSGASTMHIALVNKASAKLPAMVYVKANDANESFLMRKIDATHCALDAQCVGSTCGDSMPNSEALLSTSQRDLIRRWILQGAKKD